MSLKLFGANAKRLDFIPGCRRIASATLLICLGALAPAPRHAHASPLVEPNQIVLPKHDPAPSPFTDTAVIAAVFEQLYTEFHSAPGAAAVDSVRMVSGSSSVLIVLTESNEPNAFALPADEENKLPSQIVLSRTLLEQLENRSELAFVLAHEMTHIIREHEPLLPPVVLTAAQLKRISDVHKSWEFEADAGALRLLEERGFLLDAPGKVLERLAAAEKKHAGKHTDEEQASDHPPVAERILALSKRAGGAS